MVDYRELTESDKVELRRKRILSLEADHYRLILVAREFDEGGSDGIAEQLSELERRIAIHTIE